MTPVYVYPSDPMQDESFRTVRFAPPEPPAGLFEVVLRRIASERVRVAVRRRLVLFGTALAASISLAVPALLVARDAFAQSGFLQYASLAFSDTGALAGAGQDFAFALLESFPVMEMAACLAVLWLFLESASWMARDLRHLRTI